jgi:hypothetical protein
MGARGQITPAARHRGGLGPILAAFLLLAGLVPAHADGDTFGADSKLWITSTQVANNTTAIVISSVPATVYSIQAFNNSTSIAYIKLYNAASGITCGTGTPQARYQISGSASAPLMIEASNGVAYGNGITLCVTTGYADSDATAPAATEYIVNIAFKKSF